MIIRPVPNSDLYELVEEEKLIIDGKQHSMHPGYRSNGASIPRFFQFLSTTQYNPRVIRGAFWHDFFYDTHGIRKARADQLLLEIILEDGIEKQVAENIYNSVADFGKPAWKRAYREYKKSHAERILLTDSKKWKRIKT